MIYDGKDTNSGLYVFNPKHEASEVEDLELNSVQIENGPIMSCLTAFLVASKKYDVVFSSRFCLSKNGEERDVIKQQVRAYSSIEFEVVLRTDVIQANEEEVSLEYFTDDSVKQIKRHLYSQEEARLLGYDYSQDDEQMQIGLNTYPCTKGLLV